MCVRQALKENEMQLVVDQLEQQDRIPTKQLVDVHTAEGALTTDVEWTQKITPDLMEAFRIPPPEISPPRPLSHKEVDALMAWLRSDSLDWDAVERGDAWID
jgi:hypothetical protein